MTPVSRTYRTYVFDCDGVILDSNRLKTDAFRTAALPYGETAAQALVDYHIANGGISRFVKFRHFLDFIVAEGARGPDMDMLLATYADAVAEGLLNCAIAHGLAELRASTAGARWMIVSGGSQEELRAVFAERGIAEWFDGGIFGSPDTKDEILAREIADDTIEMPALFIGDSTYDWRAASGAGLDFVFATWWTEVTDWPAFVERENLPTIGSIEELTP